MVAFGRSEFELTARQDDGQPLRAHLASLSRMGDAKAIAMLDSALERPAHTDMVWRAFCELNNERGTVGMGDPARIAARSIIDWCWVTGCSLELWERQALRALDNAWMESQK